MNSIVAPDILKASLPDHTQLPDKDNVPLRNSLEPWQSTLLTETLDPVLHKRHPDGDYFIGQDTGIYWEKTDPPGEGCKSPDWYLVLDVPRLLDGLMRRSYVLWQELTPPLIILEYASDEGKEERDDTPRRGKFWVFERRIRPAYYGIYLPEQETIEMYHLVEDRFEQMKANALGRYPIASLGVELGIWRGKFGDYEIPWMRWWDAQATLLPTGQEHAQQAQEKAQQANQRADAAEEKARRLSEKLRALGINPEEQ
jgi:Uma2 family endonuclease